MKRAYLLALCLSLVGLVSGTARADTLSVEELLDHMAERLSAIQTYREDGLWTIEMKHRGEQVQEEMRAKLTFVRPNRLRLETDHAVLVTDGHTVSMRMSMFSDAYVGGEVGETLSETLTPFGFLYESLFPDRRAMWSEDPRLMLEEFAAGETVQVDVLADEDLGGRPHWTVLLQVTAPEIGMEGMAFRAWIDQEYGLVSRVVLEIDDDPDRDLSDLSEMERMLAETFESMKAEYQVLSWAVNEPVDDAVFAFEPDEGEKRVASMDELMAAARADVPEDAAKIGAEAPDFELELLNGETFRLTDHAGKVVVIDFWATWCPPCVAAMPHMRELELEFEDDDVVILGISSDRPGDAERVQAFLDEHEIEYPVGIDVAARGERIGDAYDVRAIPTLLVIDREGIIRDVKVGFTPEAMADVRAKIRDLLAL